MSTATAIALNRESSRGIYADEQMAAALVYFRNGQIDKAETIYRKIAKKNAANAGAHHMLGIIARKKGREERAVQLLIKAAKLDPQRPEILCDLGNTFKSLSRHKDAIKAHRMVLTLMPESPEAHSNLGSAYKAAGKIGKSIVCFESALQIRPNDEELKYNLANGLIAAERFAEAEDLLRQVIYDKPDHIRAQINLGASLKQQGRYDAAIRRLQKAVVANPGSAEAHWNLGLTQLAVGQYEQGWAEYEWRTQIDNFAMQRMTRPQWQGESLNGATLLIHAEQGFGDTIQFARYIDLIDEAGGDIVLSVPKRLIPLVRLASNKGEIIPDDKPAKHDIQSPLMSLPRLFHDGLPYEPAAGRYLDIHSEPIESWREKLGPKTGMRIGIAWQGNAAYQNDEHRSIPLVSFEHLARLEGIELFSLQKGEGSEQIAELAWRDRITDLTTEMDVDAAFIDTLAVMKNLDLVVTSDTSIAHLAGAAGVPVWVALGKQPDWRWGLNGENSPWYSSMRLYRQKTAGDWDEVFERIAAKIAENL